VPLNPVDEDTLTEVEPEAPGAVIVTWLEPTAAKKPGWIVNVIGGELVLPATAVPLKLASPL
jgi:hypothetical protein